ncbi:EamA family transporter [Cohnella rhizosphaerae]
MHWFAVAVLSALAFGLAGFFMKASQMRGGALSSLLIGLYASGTAGFWIQALLTRTWQPLDWRVWSAGAVIGLGSAWGNLLFMRAIARGPASLVSPLTNANIVIVMAAGILLFDETPHATGLLGALWLLTGIALLSLRRPRGSAGSEAAASKPISIGRSWYPLALAAMGLFVLRNGGLKVTDRIGLDSASVLWAGYLLSLVCFLAVARLTEGNERHAPGSRTGTAVHASSRAAVTGFRWGAGRRRVFLRRTAALCRRAGPRSGAPRRAHICGQQPRGRDSLARRLSRTAVCPSDCGLDLFVRRPCIDPHLIAADRVKSHN